MKLSKLAQDCLHSLTPSRVRVAETWAAEWSDSQWAVYAETREAVEAANPDLDFRLADFFAAWTAQHGKPDKDALRFDRLAQGLRAARDRENAVAGLEMSFSSTTREGLLCQT